jgi:hypothetical protein
LASAKIKIKSFFTLRFVSSFRVKSDQLDHRIIQFIPEATVKVDSQTLTPFLLSGEIITAPNT